MPSNTPSKRKSISRFNSVDCWIFDLDNTLYPKHLNLLNLMREKTYDYMIDLLGGDRSSAVELYEHYELNYGTSMRGLMLEHKIEPNGFLEFVHDIDHSLIPADPNLTAAIRALPGTRIIYTNGTVPHAQKVLERLGAGDHFEGIFDIVWADLDPKPHRAPYERLLSEIDADPKKVAMFEDTPRNLEIPFKLGAATILIRPEGGLAEILDAEKGGCSELPYVDYVTDDLLVFLTEIQTHSTPRYTINLHENSCPIE